jgi:hypothetical protein
MARLYLKHNHVDDAWYFESMREVFDAIKSNKPIHSTVKQAFKVYEETYGTKLKFDSFGYLEYAEFNSDSDLTMFLLRWK